MAVKIRLRRMGQKKAPFYRIVVADSRSKRDGKCIAEIGTYDPNIEPSAYKVNEEEAKKWLAAGAQPTEVVARIFKAGRNREIRNTLRKVFLKSCHRQYREVCNERIS